MPYSPGDKVRYSDDTAVDQVAIIAILNRLDYAESSLMTGEFYNAIENIDMAWAKLPNTIREDLEQPSSILRTRLKAEVPSLAKLYSSHLYDNVSFGSQQMERVRMAQGIAQEIVKDYIVKIVTSLDKYGLYIRKERVIQQTSEKTMKEQPSLTKLPSTMKRDAQSTS